MQLLISLVMSVVLALGVAAIAILSVQNATPVSLHFLNLTSIQMPVGVALTFCCALGIIGGALTYPLRGIGKGRQP